MSDGDPVLEGRVVGDEPDDDEELTLEESVKNDLDALPGNMRRGGVARVAIMCARVLDMGGLPPRDAAGFARELRLSLAQLREMAPGEVRGDITDEVKQKRERRLAGE
jgi:hypothetical protein